MQPRQHIYNFAHRVLKQDAHLEEKLWSILQSDRVISYLQMRWHDAGEGTTPVDGTGLLPVALQTIGDIQIQLVHLPEPQAPTEAYYVAFVRTPQQPFPLRYFVLERSSAGGAFWSEWRPNMRIRGADVPEWPADMARRVELPAPYLAEFVDAIVTEVTAFPEVASRPAPTLPSRGAGAAAPVMRVAPPARRSSARGPLILIGVSVAVILAIFLMSLR